jgi:16S rRNA (adenine1518-N6/adenine1519-N6)-dimethyltransferase
MGNPAPHRARKRFGQHFLHDKNIIDKILRAISPGEGENLLEIGPGQGALTYPLLRQCKKLTAVELDRDLIPQLSRRSVEYGDLDIINTDILDFDISGLPGEKPYRIVGNLPYNISTPLMFHLLKSTGRIIDMHFMVQKEVAQRIVAPVNSDHYGRLSIMMQYQCECQYLFDVAPGCFTPPPKVNSAIIRLIPLTHPQFEVGDSELFATLVKTAFGQRRKSISNSLKTMVSAEVFHRCGIDKQLRAENLQGQDYARLSRTLLEVESNG